MRCTTKLLHSNWLSYWDHKNEMFAICPHINWAKVPVFHFLRIWHRNITLFASFFNHCPHSPPLCIHLFINLCSIFYFWYLCPANAYPSLTVLHTCFFWIIQFNDILSYHTWRGIPWKANSKFSYFFGLRQTYIHIYIYIYATFLLAIMVSIINNPLTVSMLSTQPAIFFDNLQYHCIFECKIIYKCKTFGIPLPVNAFAIVAWSWTLEKFILN